ncbi:MAG: DUF2480 family protein [Flavobacteriaceae bacterium]|nr:DUF2480 family protein [Flavobacteriaceae bacterium]
MPDEIINKVANSKLVSLDLEDYYPKGERVLIDIKKWLFQEQVLIEKDYRSRLKEQDWTTYQEKYVGIICSSDAIIPSWAYLLLTVHLAPYAKKIVVGDLEQLETILFEEVIAKMDIEEFADKPVIIKGCSEKFIPNAAYALLIQRLYPVVSSLMYGEACSSVPLYKRIKG